MINFSVVEMQSGRTVFRCAQYQTNFTSLPDTPDGRFKTATINPLVDAAPAFHGATVGLTTVGDVSAHSAINLRIVEALVRQRARPQNCTLVAGINGITITGADVAAIRTCLTRINSVIARRICALTKAIVLES